MTSPSPRISAPAAAQRLKLVQQHWPAATQLARVLSLAVRIEPSLLRAARLAAGLDAAAEADLWFSGIIASSGTLGISFVPAVAEALRRELAASPGERALAWKLVEEHHGQQPWSIRLEERINYLTTGPSDQASEIEDLLAAALSELHEVRARDEQAALGIARWLLAALARAPAAARATPTAAAAELAAGVHLGGRLGGADQLTQAENSELLPWLLDHLGTTVLPVRLLPGAVALGGDPPDGIALPVPATDPLAVSVIWGSGADSHHEHVRVPPGEELLVPVEATEVELRTLTGGGVVLRRAGIGRILVNGVDQGAGFAVADYAILTAAHVLGDRALQSGSPNDPPGSFASEASAVEAEASEDAEAGLNASAPAPDVIYIPEDGEPLNVRVVATDSELDVALLKPERPAPAILPVGQIQPGQKWRLQVLPGRDQTGSPQGVGAPAASIGGVTTSGYPHPEFALAPQRGASPSLPGQSGAAIILENPWGAVIGLLLAETTQLVEVAAQEQEAGEAKTEIGLQALLRATPIDAIVASFNLARQITPATAALVHGKWPETQPLEDLLALPLRNGALPVLADVEPAQLSLSPGRSATPITPTLQSALRASAFVLFTEPAHAPSWAAYEVLRAELPGARLLVPNQRTGTLMALATHPDLAAYPEQVVVWLGDMPRYLSEIGDLDPLVLSRFEGQHQTVLTGTISAPDLERLRTDASQPGPIQQLLDQAIVISLVLEGDTASEASSDVRPLGQGDDTGKARAAADESEREGWQRAAEAGNTDAMANLATSTGEAGDAAGARDQFAALLPIRERVSGPEHPDTLTARFNLAYWTGEAGDAAGARDQFAALLPIEEQVLGAEHPDTLTTRANLAYWTGEAGDAAGARDQFAALLPIRERVSGPEHPDTLTARFNLATSTGEAGDAAGARDQLAALLPIRERVSGPEHPDTLTARFNLARWTGQAGDAAGARDELAALLPIEEQVLGVEHRDTLIARANLAYWTGEAGDAAGARDQFAALLPIRERVFGPEHPDTLTVRANLAYWTGEAGDAAGARDQFAALLPIRERVFGPEHPDTLTVRANLAYWTGEAGDAAGARDQLAALLPIRERVFGPEHPDTLTVRANLAYWTGQAGDAAEGEAPPKSLLIKTGEQSRTFHTDFTAGRGGNFVVDDEFASSHHARFRVSRGQWYVEDLGSTNGTWLNGRRIRAPQRVKKGDKIKIGRTVMIVEPHEADRGPVVTGVSPGTGPVAGGTNVTVTGSGFTNPTAVRFGQVAAPSLVVTSDTKLLAISPQAAIAGSVDVTVTTEGATSAISAAGQFTYGSGDAYPARAKAGEAGGALIEPEPLPEALRVTLESPRPRVREAAVAELAELLDDARPGLALGARQALERIAEDDLPQVAALARIAVGAPAGAAADQVRRELSDRAHREEQA